MTSNFSTGNSTLTSKTNVTLDSTLDPGTMSIAVLQGGVSAEREVSLRSGDNVTKGLRDLGFSVSVYDAADLSFIEELRSSKPDIVFNALHGRFGEDGTIQGLLEILNMPYTGSGVLASALAMNKQASKDIFIAAGLTTPKGFLMQQGDFSFAECAQKLGTNCLVVKPNGEGSSVGVSIVNNEADFASGFNDAKDSNHYALVEECIPGREITVGVLEDACGNASALPVIEIIPKTDFYHYENKYAAGAVSYVVPAKIDVAATEKCKELALKAHLALGCHGYSRSDIRLTDDGVAYLLETNTLPGLTEDSLIPKAVERDGIQLPELLVRIVKSAYKVDEL